MIADGLVRGLRKDGYAVDHVANGIEADASLMAQNYDLVILDVGLPRLSGLEVLRRLRARRNSVPVMILTARDAVEERVRGLDSGADDYMTKPFALPELAARARALTRRSNGNGAGSSIVVGALSYDQSSRTTLAEGRVLDLSARETGLLEVLLMRAGRLVSKEQIIDHLCSWGEEISYNAIEVYVHRLRKKIESHGVHITTVRGLGYCLNRGTAIS